MIDYELAKQLKDAGFPQTGQLVEMWQKPNGGYTAFPNGPIKFPTLEELIDACGEKFDCLWFTPEGWEDKTYWRARCKHDYGNHTCDGSTPLEAVAHLWLDLNKKND